ncbi:MAG TPA: helicase-related protein, partial [Candidatus Dormibacteraeota bacterium]|nr:helicase-related protein [Candidatus Dormibacteraeota bacterium]
LARCDLHGVDLTTAAEKAAIDRALQSRLSALEDRDERRVVAAALDTKLTRRGLAMHHAGVLPYVKETVERMFQAGMVKAVFATETLSLGLNMPARSCVISSFTKFDGTAFATLTSGALTQLMGRAGRRGIDVVGHGVILKESDVDVRDIYDAAISGEFSVDSKFAPTYAMVLSLLRTRSSAEAEALLEKSFGQFQSTRQLDHWEHRKANLEERLSDLQRQRFRHPRVPCTERTLTQYLRANADVTELQTLLRRSRREHWQDRRRGRFGRGGADPGQRYEALRRKLKAAQRRIAETPCPHCPVLSEHRAHRNQVSDVKATLEGGQAELESAQTRYRREFRALRAVLQEGGFLDGDAPTPLGLLAEALFGERALVIADAIAAGTFDGLTPEELAASLVMLVAEDRGRERPAPGRRRFPSPAVEHVHRSLRRSLARLAEIERVHGVTTMAPLSYDFVEPAHAWTRGDDLAEIELPQGADLGDVVKAVKNLYSLLRQMEQGLHGHPLLPVVQAARERVERDLIRRV